MATTTKADRLHERPMTRITRTVDRRTGEVRYWIDDGGPQLWGPSYPTRDAAQAVMHQ